MKSSTEKIALLLAARKMIDAQPVPLRNRLIADEHGVRPVREVKERDIRKALKKRVEDYGGEVRALKWLGRSHAPDVICIFGNGAGRYIVWVETKAPGGRPRPGQLREHERLQDAGALVKVISTLEQLDDWLPPP